MMSALTYIVLIVFAIFGIQYWLKNKRYTFEAEDVAKIVKRHVGKDENLQAKFSNIALEFEQRYPGHILPEEVREWLFVNCGGWMGSMYLLHASLTEYVLFFGTAIDTQGNSGRYWANISDTIITGSFHRWKEGNLQTRLYSPGETVYHELGEVAGVQWTAGTWMVEYGRGFVPSALGFALGDTIFSALDFVQVFKILRMYARGLVQETLLQMFDIMEKIKQAAQ